MSDMFGYSDEQIIVVTCITRIWRVHIQIAADHFEKWKEEDTQTHPKLAIRIWLYNISRNLNKNQSMKIGSNTEATISEFNTFIQYKDR